MYVVVDNPGILLLPRSYTRDTVYTVLLGPAAAALRIAYRYYDFRVESTYGTFISMLFISILIMFLACCRRHLMVYTYLLRVIDLL